jgi:hypothetical protein
MLSLASPRALALSTLALTVTLATGSARAEPPAAPAAPVAPALAAPVAPAYPMYPPPGYLPPAYPQPLAYANAGDPANVEYPPEMRVRSSSMIAGGVLLLSFGLVGVIAGSSMVGAHVPTPNSNEISPCFDEGGGGCGTPVSTAIIPKPGMKTAGIVTLVGSVVAMGAGIPLLIVGAKKVPVHDDAAAKAAKLTPTLQVGSAGATLTWQF